MLVVLVGLEVVEVLELVAQAFMFGSHQLPNDPLSHVFNCDYKDLSLLI